jgi:hypothetical protein
LLKTCFATNDLQFKTKAPDFPELYLLPLGFGIELTENRYCKITSNTG